MTLALPSLLTVVQDVLMDDSGRVTMALEATTMCMLTLAFGIKTHWYFLRVKLHVPTSSPRQDSGKYPQLMDYYKFYSGNLLVTACPSYP